jgi:hypothetical protein
MGLEERGRGNFTLRISDGKEVETAAFIGTVTCQGSINVRALGSLVGKMGHSHCVPNSLLP